MPSVEEILEQAALNAGKAVIDSAPSEGIIDKEGRANFVTAADLASEKIIMDLISRNFPDHEILSEETDSSIKDLTACSHLWVIDPIDGTNNFRYERGYSAVSIGYVEQGILKAGAVYDPFRGQLFTAQAGNGAFLNGKPVKVGSSTDITQAVLATDNSYDSAGTKRNLEIMLSIEPTPWYLMRGSAVLGEIDAAAGRTDLYFHTALKPWDNAAAFLIASEAGATVLDIDGNETNFTTDNVVIGNHALVEQFLQATNKARAN